MWRTLAKLGVSTALIAVLFGNQDISALFKQIVRADRTALVLALGFLALIAPTLALRWSVVLRALSTPRDFRTTFPLVMIGQFFSQTLPSAVGGDVVRVWLMHKTGVPTAVVISGVLVDRIVGVAALLLFAMVEMPWLMSMFQGTALAHGLLALVAAGFAGFGLSLVFDRMPAFLNRFRAVEALGRVSKDLRITLASPRSLIPAIGYGLINQLWSAVAAFELARGLGLSIDLAAFLWIIPLGNLVQTVPISIGGWGIREGFFVAALGLAGLATQADALALSILYGLLNIVVSLPGALIWLMQSREDRGQMSLAMPQLADQRHDQSVLG